MPTASFRFYEELNEFLPRHWRKRDIPLIFKSPNPVRHLIETLGVPHTEVEIILCNGRSVDLDHPVSDGDRFSIYPMFEALDVTPLLKLRSSPLRTPHFLADAHLGKLAGYLRMLGFDTLYQNAWQDADLVRIAVEQKRILLTRDRALLMYRDLTHGCYLHPRKPRDQLAYLMERLDLCGSIQPFNRCMQCNGTLHLLSSDRLPASVPERVLLRHKEFLHCSECHQVYWKGTHYQAMMEWISELCAKSF